MTILLTGFMGAGKSTVGKALAEMLSRQFFDLDEVVEQNAGTSVREIFASDGEVEFRRLEREALARLLRSGEAVVAAGGGTLVESGRIDEHLHRAVVVWIDAPLDLIERRIGEDGVGQRPLYADSAAVRELYSQRLPAYARADVRVAVDADDSPRDVAERVVELLAALGEGRR